MVDDNSKPNAQLELDGIKAQLAETRAALEREQVVVNEVQKERDELERHRRELEQQHRVAIAARSAAMEEVQRLKVEVARAESALADETQAHAATNALLTEEQGARQLVEIERDDLKLRLTDTERRLGATQLAHAAAQANADRQRNTKNIFIATTVAGAASHLLRKK